MLLTQRQIGKIAILASIIGMLTLFFSMQFFAPRQIPIESISKSLVGKEITVQGIARNVYYQKDTLFFELFGLAKIKAIKFFPQETDLQTIKENSIIEVRGTVQTYRKELEIIVKEVKKID